MFLPILAMIHKLDNRGSADSRLKGGLARTLIAIFGLIVFLAWVAALIVFPLGIKNRYVPCDFSSTISQWGCRGPFANQPADSEKLDELYGERDVDFPIIVTTVDSFGNTTTTTSTRRERIEWDVLSGWYLAMLATLFLIPTVLLGLVMKNKKPRVVTQTTTTTNVKEQYVAPAVGTGRATTNAYAAPTTVVTDNTYGAARI